MRIKNRLFKRLAIYIGIAVFLSVTASAMAIASYSQNETIEALLLEGEKYLLEFNYSEAIVSFQKVLNLDNKNVDAYLGLGEAYSKSGNTDEEIRILLEGYAMTSNDRIRYKLDDIYYELANFYINNNDLEQAALVLARGVRLTNSDVLAQLLDWLNEEMENAQETDADVSGRRSGAVSSRFLYPKG